MYVYKEDDIEDLYNEPDPRDDNGYEEYFVRWSEYILSADWDFVVDRKWTHNKLKTTTYLKCKPRENMSFIFSSKQWAKLLNYREKNDHEVNTHSFADYYYFANMKDDYVGLHIFHQLAHPMKCHVDCMCEVCTLYLLYPYCEGISIGFNEWKRLLELVPTIHEEYPELAKEQLAHKREA